MENSTPWWRSKTVIAGIVAFVGGLGSIFGYEVAPADQEQIVEIISSGMILVGSIGAVIGHIKSNSSKEDE